MCASVLVPVGNAVAFWWGEIASFHGCVIGSDTIYVVHINSMFLTCHCYINDYLQSIDRITKSQELV